MTFGSLFAGIGGFDLGFERAGMTCKWQVEIDPYCNKVLAKHWPDVKRHDDVRTFPPEGDWSVDVICGGFPCQDISNAGKRAGIDGERSGLWSEYVRIIRVVRPRYVVVENVAALLVRGMGRVLGDLAACGFDAEWDVLPASAFGAPHRRERVWVVAHASDLRLNAGWAEQSLQGTWLARTPPVADSEYGGIPERRGTETTGKVGGRSSGVLGLISPGGKQQAGEVLANAAGFGQQRQRSTREQVEDSFGGSRILDWHCGDGGVWSTEPDVGRVAHGVPRRVDRLRGLGNAVVPQVAEWIGRRRMDQAQGDANGIATVAAPATRH